MGKHSVLGNFSKLPELDPNRHLYAPGPPSSQEEIEEVVESTFWELYNRGYPAGPKAIRFRLELLDDLEPIPTVSEIEKIMKQRGCTREQYPHGDLGEENPWGYVESESPDSVWNLGKNWKIEPLADIG